MTRFTLKGAAAIIEDHQKSTRKLEAENDALKAVLNGHGFIFCACDQSGPLWYLPADAPCKKAEARVAEMLDCYEGCIQCEKHAKKEAPRP